MYPIPEPFSSAALLLTFEPDHPCGTHISDGTNGKLLYVVDTEVVQQSPRRIVTEVRQAAGETLATFEWRSYKSDLVSFGPEGQPGSSSDWLKKSNIPFKDTVTFKDEAWKGYKWKGYAPGLVLQLYSETDKSTPLAKFYKGNSQSLPACLVVDESIASSTELLDQVVVSFLYLEKARRERDEDDFHALPSQSRRAWNRPQINL